MLMAMTEKEAETLVNQRLNAYSDRYADKGIVIEQKENYVTDCKVDGDMVIVSYTVNYQGETDSDLDLLFMDGEEE